MGRLDQVRNQYLVVARTSSVIYLGAVSLYKIDSLISMEPRLAPVEEQSKAIHTTNKFVLNQIDRLNNAVFVPRGAE